MGLDMSHDAWHGAYSAFKRFREEVATAAGIPLVQAAYPKEYGGGSRLEPDIPWDRFTAENLQGDWDTPPDDPLFILLVHSDCDGRIPTQYCEHLANRLEQLIPALPSEGAGHLALGGSQAKARQLVEGLRDAAAAGEDVEFG